MKNPIIIITTLCFIFLGTIQIQAQDINLDNTNYVVLSKNIQQLKPVLLTANALAIEDGKKYGAFYVIICGKTVKDIPNNSDFKVLLKKAKAQKIKVFACGFSLNKFNVSADQLPDDIEITENGILYGFQLAKQGFITLSI